MRNLGRWITNKYRVGIMREKSGKKDDRNLGDASQVTIE